MRDPVLKKEREKSRKTNNIDLWPLQRSILVDTLVHAHTNAHTPIRDGEEGEEKEKRGKEEQEGE